MDWCFCARETLTHTHTDKLRRRAVGKDVDLKTRRAGFAPGSTTSWLWGLVPLPSPAGRLRVVPTSEGGCEE